MQPTDPWVAELDPTSGKYFYYNNTTGETSWTVPAPAVAASPWISEVDPTSGDTFYVNETTGVTTWDRPVDFDPHVLDDLRQENNQSGGGGGPKKQMSTKWKRAFAKVRVMVALNQKFKKPSWEKHFDDETGEFFYHNTVTDKSQWTEPESFVNSIPEPHSPSAQRRAKFFQEGGEDNEKREGKGGSGLKSAAKTTGKNELDMRPIVAAVAAGDLETMLASMEKGVAQASQHRGRSLFSGARESNLDSSTKETTEEEEKNKKQKQITISEKEGKEGEDGKEEEQPKIISEKAKDMYRVREYRRKRFQPIINQTDARGHAALHVACERGNEQIIRALIDLGADLNVRDKSFNTPLHLAVQKSHLRCVYILLRAGADPSLRTKWGQSPYDVAKYKNYLRICRLFENGEKEFDIVELFVDRKWYQVDVHLVRHGKMVTVPIEDTVFYVKTKYRTKAHTHHKDLH